MHTYKVKYKDTEYIEQMFFNPYIHSDGMLLVKAKTAEDAVQECKDSAYSLLGNPVWREITDISKIE